MFMNSNTMVRRECIYNLVTLPDFYTQKTTGWGGSRDTIKRNLVKFCGRLTRKKIFSECDFITSVDNLSV